MIRYGLCFESVILAPLVRRDYICDQGWKYREGWIQESE